MGEDDSLQASYALCAYALNWDARAKITLGLIGLTAFVNATLDCFFYQNRKNENNAQFIYFSL